MINFTFIVSIYLAVSGDTTPAIEVLTARGEWVRATRDDSGVIRSEKGVDIGATALAWSPVSDETTTMDRPPFAMTRLSDGQIIIAAFGGFHEGPVGPVVRWKHPGIGLMDIPVERTSFIQVQPMSQPPIANASDEIVLRNGDRVTGFIESFGEPIVIETDGKKREIPSDRIAGLSLVSKSPTIGAVRVWLTDGSVIDGSSIAGVVGGGFVLQGMSLINNRSSLPIEAEEIRCVSQSPKRIVPLSALKAQVLPPTAIALPRAQYPAPKISLTDDPLGASAIEVRGPERLIYEIPKGFSVLNAHIEIPPSVRPWGDCVVVLRQNSHEIGRYPLSIKNQSAQIMVSVQPGPLEFEIEEAGGGPIGDIVILRRAILIAADVGG